MNGIFTYDENSVLVGLYFMPATLTPKIVSTADFEETAIKVGADGFELEGRLTRIDSENIYIIGHSQGGMLAPYVAQQNDRVKGFISLAGSPNKVLEETVLRQNERILSAQGFSKEQAEELLKPVKDEIAKIASRSLAKTDISLGSKPAGYWYSLLQVTGPEIASVIDCSALILQGDKDVLILEDLDYEHGKTLLHGNKNAEFMLFEGLNHLFMPSDGDSSIIDVTEYNDPNTVSSDVIKTISDFIAKNY